MVWTMMPTSVTTGACGDGVGGSAGFGLAAFSGAVLEAVVCDGGSLLLFAGEATISKSSSSSIAGTSWVGWLICLICILLRLVARQGRVSEIGEEKVQESRVYLYNLPQH